MDTLLVFGVGVAVGALLSWAVININLQFQESKKLRTGAEKTRKEIREKALKAREDSNKARAKAVRSTFFIVLLALAAIFLLWLTVITVLPELF